MNHGSTTFLYECYLLRRQITQGLAQRVVKDLHLNLSQRRARGARDRERPARSVDGSEERIKSDTGDPLHTQEPVTVASFRTWRGWRECVA